MFLIGTDVLSALGKRHRNTNVEAWFTRQRTADLFLSVVTIGEIERGIALQQSRDPDFAALLVHWLDQVIANYGDQVLSFDLAAARRWGVLSATLGNDSADLQIAATALEHGLTVVTRNVSDFSRAGVATLDPFKAPPQKKR
jgi:predicted nucleic acid-binding protein